MPVPTKSFRHLRRFGVAATALIVALATTLLASSPASATDYEKTGGIFVACGWTVVVSAPSGCLTLDGAVAAARTYSLNEGGDPTIELEPGNFCPLDLSDLSDLRALTIVGMGMAGFPPSDTPTSVSGPTAALSTIMWDQAECGGAPINTVTLGHSAVFQNITLRNLTVLYRVDGPRVGIQASLPGSGVHLFLRDVIVQGFDTPTPNTGFGIKWFGDNLLLQDSALLDNTYGLSSSGESEVDDSTIADGGYGVDVSGWMTMRNVTIAHNTYAGVQIDGFGNSITVSNTVVAANGAAYFGDCSGTVAGDWETSGSTSNLEGSSCRPQDALGDITFPDNGTIGEPDRAGITPSIYPPGLGIGKGDPSACSTLYRTDQQERLRVSGAHCDIGSVDISANDVADPETYPTALDLGSVPAGTTGSGSVEITQNGAGEVDVAAVTVDGAGFSLPAGQPGCLGAVLIPSPQASSCVIAVRAVAPAVGVTAHGTLHIYDSVRGWTTVPVQITGAPVPPGIPTNLHGTAGNGKVTVAWTAPTGGTAAAHYELQSTVDAGTHWVARGSYPGTGATVTGLTNGTSYRFRVRGLSSTSLAGAWSATSPAYSPQADHTAITTTGSTTISYGHSATISGVITDSTTHTALAGAYVVLQYRAGTAGTFHSAVATHADAAGHLHVAVTPHANTQYRLVYPATAAHLTVTGAVQTVHVAQVVHAAAKAGTVKHGHPVIVYGSLVPSVSGAHVSLQRYTAGHWVTLTTATVHSQLMPTGHTAVGFVFSRTLGKGTYKLRGYRAATSTTTAGVSGTLTVKVV